MLALGTAIVILVSILHVVRPKAPKEMELLQSFQNKRAAFEQLKDMFKADDKVKLRRVAEWGIETEKPEFKGAPTPANFPMDRYREYLRLLHEIGSPQALNNQEHCGNPMLPIWEGIWLDHRMHISISWMDTPPTNQVASLDDCRNPKLDWDPQHFYKRIEGNWYFDTDMRPF